MNETSGYSHNLAGAVARSAGTLKRYGRLFTQYLRPLRLSLAALGAILAATIALQILAPLLAGRFLDRAAGGAALGELFMLAGITIALAVAGQALAIAETYVAERVGWTATNELRADLLAHLLRLDATFHTAHTAGELIERADGDVATLAR
ncbi:MAG TPA: ABC transporter transmembrane domain-containing protein, partial [Roseiflexaceae bacterium]|nr:ABC transporter transmembrane domain-containing protein [Roseiflexaceae bacterium]